MIVKRTKKDENGKDDGGDKGGDKGGETPKKISIKLSDGKFR